jgi:predicted RNA binding protein YcfA (HicA-like mRNA interferase family)
MPCLPVLKAREAVRALKRLGFVEVCRRGAHLQFRHPDGRGATIPFHSGRDSAPLLLRQIITDVGVTQEEFLHHVL